MNQKRIFISTKITTSDKLYGLVGSSDFRELRQKLDTVNIGLLENNEAIFFDTDTRVFNVENNNANIIIIQDSITKLPDNINIDKENDYLLYHHQTVEHIDKIVPLFDNHKQGQHTPQDKYFYLPAFKIIIDDATAPANKADKIIEYVFSKKEKQLNLALKLLHSLLCGKENADNSAIKELEKEKKIDISEMLTLLKGKPFTDEYNQSLTEFRNELLVKVQS